MWNIYHPCILCLYLRSFLSFVWCIGGEKSQKAHKNYVWVWISYCLNPNCGLCISFRYLMSSIYWNMLCCCCWCRSLCMLVCLFAFLNIFYFYSFVCVVIFVLFFLFFFLWTTLLANFAIIHTNSCISSTNINRGVSVKFHRPKFVHFGLRLFSNTFSNWIYFSFWAFYISLRVLVC